MNNRPFVHIYTDGGCSPNPGRGGWAAVLIAERPKKARKEIHGAVPNTTNNRMELTAALEAFRALKRPCQVVLHTDSQYLRNAFTKGWLNRWQRNGWTTAGRDPVLNTDLWRALLACIEPHGVEWRWVKGHGRDRENNRCDELARMARERLGRHAHGRARRGVWTD
jgi:ribonuclease HI